MTEALGSVILPTCGHRSYSTGLPTLDLQQQVGSMRSATKLHLYLVLLRMATGSAILQSARRCRAAHGTQPSVCVVKGQCLAMSSKL